MRTTLLTILLAIAIIYVVIVAVLYLNQERLIFYPERLPPDYTFTFAERFEEVTWRHDGGTISALHFFAERPRGVILYLHGNAGSLRSWGNIASNFLPLGYDVFIPDYRGFGKSTGTITTEQILHRDAADAYAYLRERYADEEIVLYGRSLGTGIATFLATTTRPRMLILETPYVSFSDLTARYYPYAPRMLLKYPLPTERWISAVTCPVYLFHGTEDELIPYSSSQRLLALIKTEHELFTIKGGGHNNLGDFEEYAAGLSKILR